MSLAALLMYSTVLSSRGGGTDCPSWLPHLSQHSTTGSCTTSGVFIPTQLRCRVHNVPAGGRVLEGPTQNHSAARQGIEPKP